MLNKLKGVSHLFFIFLMMLVFLTASYASKPLWTFTPSPYYQPTLSITPIGVATVQYTVTNQSRRTHTLEMKAIPGITQITSEGNCSSPFQLAYQQSCTLNLLINGAALTGNILGGPVVCQQGNALQCYQPTLANNLNITRIPLARYLITPQATENGTISPSTPQVVLAGSNVTFTATPLAGYQVDLWLKDGGIAQKGGTTFTLSNIEANHTVEATFVLQGIIYAGTAGGSVYFSTDNGLTWTPTNSPSSGNAVNGIFATPNTLYVASANGKIYYSTDNGTLWNETTTIPGGGAINSVFVSTVNSLPTIYVGAQSGTVYYTTNGTTWTATTNPGIGAVNGLFITPNNSLYIGSADGNIYYSINNGSTWNQIRGPQANASVPVQNVFATSSQLYVNTRQVSTNSTLPPGTIDFEYVYSSNSLTNSNPTWTIISQITYTLFVNSDASLIHAGTQDGYVFSLTTGDELGFITYSPITSLFFLN